MRTPLCAVLACFAALLPPAWANPVKGPLLTLTGHSNEVYTVAFSPDGKQLVSASHREIKIWEAASGKEIATYLTGGTNVFGLAFSPDGKSLAVSVSKDVRILDAATGQEKSRLRCAPHFLFRLAFHPDGKHIAAAGGNNGVMPGSVHIWEISSGKEVFTLAGHTEPPLAVAYSADGKLLASCSGATSGVKAGEVRLWEAATGKLTAVLRGHSTNVYGVALSPDGRRAASASGTRTAATGGELKLWETSSGREVLQLTGHTGTIYGAVFSPDGRRLASCASDKTLKVWDVLSGKELFSSSDHTGAVYSVAFSPDRKRIATASQDKTVKVWDAIPFRPAVPAAALTAAQIGALWSDLAGEDPRRANEAIWTLISVPGQSVPLASKHLQPVAALTPAQETEAARLVRDLDHRRFAVREQAARALTALGEAVVPVLRKSLAANPPLEVRRRLSELIESLTSPARTPAQVQALRAVEILEQAESAAARELLQKLAGGLAGARLTEEARAALARLARRS